ncbi:hypothetical protein NUU61_008449 [Penicillium alfredii]|uniref:SnoaL-like domain-containing protein n=1 Tax=Penicillium alfredii TaxID=1506179 RepID=A0A9W9ELF2_9EURO|nr:uncharacterized protein NUU61_008449 [Penicillium alfredii]KAJ5083870.1 hypothetical protein NUU61_008449 [Penicillium alfredii]
MTQDSSMPIDLRERAIAFLENLTTKRDLPGAARLMHDALTLQHNDLPSMTKAEFVEFWPSVLDKSPNVHVAIKDVICQGNRVWVFSCVTGRLNEGPLDDVHMLSFAEDGTILRSHGIQRQKVEGGH